MSRIRSCLLFCLATAALLYGIGSARAVEVDGGMLAWPREDMARALSIYVPRRMAEEDVPGLAMAVVADGRLVFEQGFGTSDLADAAPVTPNTLFEAASLGKPVAAVGALSLVREGKLALDVPLGTKLEEPWLGDEDDHTAITLRQVLTHTSGLSNFVRCCSDESWETPGSGFSYSGVGYMYMGHVMAQVAEMPFDKFMRTRVLGPMGMDSSGYSLADPLVPTVARGFAPYYQPLLVFLLPTLGFFAVLAIVSALVVRVGLNRLKLNPVDFAPALILSILLTTTMIGVLFGLWALLFILAYVAAYAVFVLLASLMLLLVFAFLGLLGPADGTLARGESRTDPVVVAVAVAMVIASSFFFIGRNVPVPAMAGDTVNPAFSLRASAHDLGRFVEGYLDGAVIGPHLRDRMLSETVPVDGPIRWGLGFGVREGATGMTAWQWGANPGFQAIMVVDPRRRAGVVVLTNTAKAGPLVQEIAGHVMGEEPGWRIP
ncbi:MAG: serine hydrolase domain-containing protein [Parvibaculaceae bacterium]